MAKRSGGNKVKFSKLTPSEFFYNNRDMAGFGKPTHALYTGVRELFENALDACDGAGVHPDIMLRIEAEDAGKPDPKNYTITVEDNGPGMQHERIPDAFGTVLYGSKFGLRQARGMFGMGATMAILYGQITSSKPVVVSSGIDGKWHRYEISLDIKNNRPRILSHSVETKEYSGLRISITLKGDYGKAGARIRKYVKQSGLITPYATIRYRGPGGNGDDQMIIERVTDVVPKPPAYTIPHPHGSDAEAIKRMIASTFTLPAKITAADLRNAKITQDNPKKFPKRFSSARNRLIGALAHGMGLPASELVGCIPFGLDAVAGKLDWQDSNGRVVQDSDVPAGMCAMVGKDGEPLVKFLTRFQGVGPGSARTFLKHAGLDPATKVILMDDPMIISLTEALNTYEGFRSPDPSCLAPLGADLLEAGMRTMFEPDFIETIQRPPKSYSGSPFIVELGVAYGGKIPPNVAIHRFANRIPLLYSGGSDAVVKIIESVDWRRYGVQESSPLAVCSHICSTRVPYDSVAKEQVESTDEIDSEVKLAFMEVCRKMASYIRKRQLTEREAQRSSTIGKYIKATAEFGCGMIGKKVPSLEGLK